jgi:hypothetical protein
MSASVRRSADRWVETDFKWRDQCSAGNEERSSRKTGIAVRTLIAGRPGELTEIETFQAVQFHLPRGGYTATWNISTKAPNPCEMPTISQRADHRSGVESLLEMNQFAE